MAGRFGVLLCARVTLCHSCGPWTRIVYQMTVQVKDGPYTCCRVSGSTLTCEEMRHLRALIDEGKYGRSDHRSSVARHALCNFWNI